MIVEPGLFGVTTLVLAGTGVFSFTVFSVFSPVNLSATFGFASSLSGIPSLSSSGSVTSGMPSPSVSRWIVTGIFTTVSSVPRFSLTGISTVRSSSFGPQSVTVGVPTRFPPLSTVKPFTGPSTEIVVPGLFGVTTLVFAGTGVFSFTVFPVVFPVNLSATFGFASSLSGIPSLSSSVSTLSGIPSPSVSRWIVTGIFTTVSSVPRFNLTGISTVRSSSFGPQSVTLGVPTRFPPLSTVKPFTGLSTVIVVSGLFGVITLVFAGTGVFSFTVFPVVSPVNLSGTFGFASCTSEIPSLSSSESTLSGIPSPSVSRWIVTGTSLVTVSPPFVTLTGIVILRSSSFGPQSVTVGVPVKLPSPSTVNPLTGVSVVIVEPGLFGVTTVTGVVFSFSRTGAGGVTSAPKLPFAVPLATGLSRTTLSILLETFAVISVLSATSASEIVTTPAGVTDTLSAVLPFTVQVFPDFVTVTVSGVVLPVGT